MHIGLRNSTTDTNNVHMDVVRTLTRRSRDKNARVNPLSRATYAAIAHFSRNVLADVTQQLYIVHPSMSCHELCLRDAIFDGAAMQRACKTISGVSSLVLRCGHAAGRAGNAAGGASKGRVHRLLTHEKDVICHPSSLLAFLETVSTHSERDMRELAEPLCEFSRTARENFAKSSSAKSAAAALVSAAVSMAHLVAWCASCMQCHALCNTRLAAVFWATSKAGLRALARNLLVGTSGGLKRTFAELQFTQVFESELFPDPATSCAYRDLFLHCLRPLHGALLHAITGLTDATAALEYVHRAVHQRAALSIVSVCAARTHVANVAAFLPIAAADRKNATSMPTMHSMHYRALPTHCMPDAALVRDFGIQQAGALALDPPSAAGLDEASAYAMAAGIDKTPVVAGTRGDCLLDAGRRAYETCLHGHGWSCANRDEYRPLCNRALLELAARIVRLHLAGRLPANEQAPMLRACSRLLHSCWPMQSVVSDYALARALRPRPFSSVDAVVRMPPPSVRRRAAANARADARADADTHADIGAAAADSAPFACVPHVRHAWHTHLRGSLVSFTERELHAHRTERLRSFLDALLLLAQAAASDEIGTVAFVAMCRPPE